MAWWIKCMVYLLPALLLYACAPVATPIPDSTQPPVVGQEITAPSTVVYSPTSIPLPTLTLLPIDGPLSVKILYPAENATVDTAQIAIVGTADPGTVLTINDFILLVGEAREFTQEVSLEPGTNLIEIIASDPNDNQDFYYLTINYEMNFKE